MVEQHQICTECQKYINTPKFWHGVTPPPVCDCKREDAKCKEAEKRPRFNWCV